MDGRTCALSSCTKDPVTPSRTRESRQTGLSGPHQAVRHPDWLIYEVCMSGCWCRSNSPLHASSAQGSCEASPGKERRNFVGTVRTDPSTDPAGSTTLVLASTEVQFKFHHASATQHGAQRDCHFKVDSVRYLSEPLWRDRYLDRYKSSRSWSGIRKSGTAKACVASPLSLTPVAKELGCRALTTKAMSYFCDRKG